MREVTILVAGWFAASAAAQTAGELVDQLRDERTRAAAQQALLTLGEPGARAIADRLATMDDAHRRCCFDVLVALGRRAVGAVPKLVDHLAAQRHGAQQALDVLAELVLFHEPGAPRLARRDFLRAWTHLSDDDVGFSVAVQRLQLRMEFDVTTSVDDLIALLPCRQPFLVEAAVDLLGGHGRGVAAALPALRQLLDRPEPRILLTERRVPLHTKAAKAMLTLGATGPDDEAARAVLAGTWSPREPADRQQPARLQQRVGELVAELANAATRPGALDNLVALGSASALPVADLLAKATAPETVQAALQVLRHLGKDAAATTPQILEAVRSLPAEHTVGAIRALAAVGPWSREVVPALTTSANASSLSVFSTKIHGAIDLDLLRELDLAQAECTLAMSIAVDLPTARLAALLDAPNVLRRERALEIVRARGAECRVLVPDVARLLDATGLAAQVLERTDDGGHRMRRLDRTPHVQRLAARALLAIAATDDPVLRRAREILAQPEGKAP